jgi:SAM-dependent methyltransferase
MGKINLEEKGNIDISSVWESYWSKISESSLPIFWECSDEWSIRDLSRFRNTIDSQLPLIDFACGHGKQTRFLAKHFKKVIGVDVSKSAIEMAKSQYSATNIEYRVLDGLKPEEAEALHSEIGDTNIYMKGCLHHIPGERRSDLAKSLQILLGNTGILYLIELGENAVNYFNSLREQYGDFPKEMTIALEYGIRPGTVAIKDIANAFPEFKILQSGEDISEVVFALPDGQYLKIPMFYALMKHK